MATSTKLQNAIDAHRAGRLDAAEHGYQTVLAEDPNQPDAIHLLGVLCHQRGDSPRGAELIGRAIAINPTGATFHCNLADALRALGRLDDAERAARRAIELRADYPEALHNLGTILLRAKRPAEALAALDASLALSPDRALTLAARGDALRQLERVRDAIAAYRQAIACDPTAAGAHANLGLMLVHLGELEAGLEHCRRAVELKPGDPVCRANLGLLLLEYGQIDEAMDAIAAALELNRESAVLADAAGRAWTELGDFRQASAWFDRALRLDPTADEVRCHLARMHIEAGDPEGATAILDRVLETTPENAEAHLILARARVDQGDVDGAVASHRTAVRLCPEAANPHAALGQTLSTAGQLDAAVDAFRAALALNPRSIPALAGLATTLRGKTADDDIQQLESLLDVPWMTESRRASVWFALAQVYDGRGEYARAAKHMVAANAAQKTHREARGQGHDPAALREYTKRVIAAYTPEYFARVRGFGNPSERPVFIVGMPRSGTTLTEQILASHPRVFGAGERRFVHLAFNLLPAAVQHNATPFECLADVTPNVVERVAKWHLERLHELNADRDRVVDKMPENFQQLGWIATVFPNARIIHCTRDVRDVALSCWITQFGSIRWANDLGHLADRINLYLRVMAHYKRVLPVQVLDVPYEQLVADQESTTRRMLNFVGLDWDAGCLNFHRTERLVRTASVSQVRQPIYTRSVARWKHYEEMLRPLLGRLDEFDKL